MSGMSVGGIGAPVPQVSAAAEPQNAGQEQQAGVRETEGRTLQEMLREAREKAQERRDALRLKTPVRYGDAPIEAYARLSRARTPAEVSAASGYARRRIMQLKAAKRQDGENAEQIQAAINQLQKAVSRAGKKKNDLERERLDNSRRLKLERENQRRQAQRIKLELARRKAMRIIREGGYIREAEVDSRVQSHLAETRMELRAQAQALAEAVKPSLDAAAQQYTAQAAPSPAPGGEAVSLQA